MVEAKSVTKTYTVGRQTLKAVDDVSLSVADGEFLSIMGHSGSGKTTLLSLIGGLTKPDSGVIMVQGKDLWSMHDDALSAFRNEKISFIYQFSSLIPTLTVFENVLLPMVFGKRRDRIEERARELLAIVGLEDKTDAYPAQLSGGQQRRVAIARAFVTDPDLVLADEPTGDLDEESETEIMSFFKAMNETKGTTFVMVTHSSTLAEKAGRRMKMSNGMLSAL
ncbi:MAG: ABC transporter ATP-binding protein [Chloroflexota bacterium]